MILTAAIPNEVISSDETTASSESYQFERMWPKLAQPWYFSSPVDLSIDNEGYLYIADKRGNIVKKFSKEGALITQWGKQGDGQGEFKEINNIAIDHEANVYVTDSRNNRVQKFSSNGEFITSWGKSGTENGDFQHPMGIAVDDTHVYVGDYDRIQKFTTDGELVSVWHSNDYGDTTYFENPDSIAVDADGNIYVLDSVRDSIQKFSADGTFIDEFGKELSEEENLWNAQDFTIGNDGTIYVAKNREHGILVLDTFGNVIRSWASPGVHEGEIGSPSGICSSPEGQLYVTDEAHHRIQIFDPQGSLVDMWGSNGNGEGYFNLPQALTLNENNEVLVCDTGNHRIQHFSEQGELLNIWGSQGSKTGEFRSPQGITMDVTGDIYVSDTENDRIQKFSTTGEFLLHWGEYGNAEACDYDDDNHEPIYHPDCNLRYLNWPKGITMDPNGHLYVVDSLNHRVQVFDGEGAFITYWGDLINEEGWYWPYTQNDGKFQSPTGIAYDPKGFVYVADTLNDRIQKFLPGGGFLTKWGSWGSEEEQFQYPQGTAIDANGDIYIADSANNRIQKFTAEGVFVSQFGSSGSGPGQFNTPTDIAISPEGKIYVADKNNHRIQVFTQRDYTSDIKKAIIVAGGGDYPGNTLWGATQMCANYAYRALIYQGFDKQTIHYLSSDTDLDLDNNGEADDVDFDATSENLQSALLNWAKDADELMLYITDHGGDGTFRMTDTELLQTSDLNDWLNELQRIKNARVVVIYDACQSGSFLPILSTSQNENRIVIASAQSDEPAYFTAAGALSFSSFFWGNIFNGMTVGNAFFSARNSTRYSYPDQSPLMDDNGNGMGNDDDDGILAREIHIGNGVVSADDLPVIGSAIPIRHLYGESSATISLSDVTDASGISSVWATLTPPDHTTSDPSIPILSVKTIDFTPLGDNRFEAEIEDLDQIGTYTLAVFAKDKNNTLSLPVPSQIIQHGSLDTIAPYTDDDLTLFIPFLTYDTSCFSITLKLATTLLQDDNLIWYHESSLLMDAPCPTDTPSMDNTMTLYLPEFQYQNRRYRFALNHYLNPMDPFRDYWILDPSSFQEISPL